MEGMDRLDKIVTIMTRDGVCDLNFALIWIN